jgi:parallel beta-helix repeat protein
MRVRVALLAGLLAAATVVLGGILLIGANRNRVRDLFVEGSAYGIALFRSAGNRIERNAARGGSLNRCDTPALVAIALFRSHRNLLRGNVAELSDFGIALSGSNRNRIADNRAAPLESDGNACVGVALFGAHDNDIDGNIAANNVHTGILVRPGSRGTLVAGNLASFNGGGDGIEVDNPRTTISGNTATGNGNPAQCLNVACA